MAAAILMRHMVANGLSANVQSRGTHAVADEAATPEAIAAVEEQGLDLSNHRSRCIDAQSVAATDLVLGLAREHVREVVQLQPGALTRAFTLKELVRRAESDPRDERDLSEWL